jgi:alanyl-tRNA synthetase
MLGNFSVCDYFKREAIGWAWELVTERLGLSPQRLWVTIYLDDDESFGIWRETGVAEERILRFGEEDNFWGPAGEMGPCGPCSEIHWDFGEDVGCGRPDCSPACDCGHFLEIWNLVFTEFYQDWDGRRTPLPKKNIDTGMGLERTAAVLQATRSPYDTDLFAPIMERVSKLVQHDYGVDSEVDRDMRIIAEHGRAATFLIADGVTPSNDGRGYVLRRIVRRALLSGRRLGQPYGILDNVADEVVTTMKDTYPELVSGSTYHRIMKVIHDEERKLLGTIENGLFVLALFLGSLSAEGNRVVSGETAFHLYDTYGLPTDVLDEEASREGFRVDWVGFEAEMERQRERTRAAHKFQLGERESTADYASRALAPTEFVGYEQIRCRSEIVSIAVDGELRESLSEGQGAELVLKCTPFYAEMGGQVGDTGEIRGEKGRFQVIDAIPYMAGGNDLVLHLGKVIEGTIAIDDEVEAVVDESRRLDIARNHTATHLLHSALRDVLGEEVHQAGSLVAPDHFRFDFTQEAPVLREEVERIQSQVNENVRRNLPVVKSEMPYREAVAQGAIALFGEKYADVVRTVRVGSADDPVSFEVCGGTHVDRTGDIGLFHILSESSIGSGMRRIEAVTGRGAEALIEERVATLDRIAHRLQASPSEIEAKLESVLRELEQERKRAVALERQLSRESVDGLLAGVQSINGVSVLATKVAASNMDAMLHMGDLLRERMGSGVIVLAGVWDNRPNFLAMVTPDLVDRGLKAGDLVRTAAQETGGGGGGKPQMAQGGGKDASKLDRALEAVKRVVGEKA